MPDNDNDLVMPDLPWNSPDAAGHAALLLVESLIHGLCDSSMLTVGEAVEIAERAVEVQADHIDAAECAGASMWRSHAMLISIAASLNTDQAGEPPLPRLLS